MRPAFETGIDLARLNERIARSAVEQGFPQRTQFTDACASLWTDGELVSRTSSFMMPPAISAHPPTN